jgi:hypothetical protein
VDVIAPSHGPKISCSALITLGMENEEIVKTDRTLAIRLTGAPGQAVDSPFVGGKHCRWLASSDGCSES